MQSNRAVVTNIVCLKMIIKPSKLKTFCFFSILSLIFICPSTSKEANFGRCHMDSCSWSKTLNSEEIVSDERGSLVKLRLLGGESLNNGNLRNPKIKWNKNPHDIYVFCSKRLPAVIMESDGEYQVDILDFWEGVPGVYESGANLYRETCHPGSENLTDEELAKKFKYSPSPETDVTIHKPTEIFSYVKH